MGSHSSNQTRPGVTRLRLPVYCLLLLAFFALALAPLTQTSPTFDEGFTLLRGYAAWRTGHLIPLGHPPLTYWLSALGVGLEPNLPDPRSLKGWYSDSYDDASRDLLWQRGLNASRIVFLGRLPIVFLGLILGAVTARWANDLLGWRGGLIALTLHALSPNLLAHSALATTDLPVAAFYTFTLYRWYRYTQAPTRLNALLTGLMLGGALASKFSALLLLPTLGLLAFIHSRSLMNKTLRPAFSNLWALGQNGLITLAATLMVIWLNYGFALNPYPLAQYGRELADLQSLASQGHPAYLFGLLSTQGWWYYHPLVFLVKTPLPLLLLLIVSIGLLGYHLVRRSSFSSGNPQSLITFILFPALLYFAAATLASLNVGYRYLLPALPLLHIFAASALRYQSPNRLSFVICHSPFVICPWLVLSTFTIAPNFLAYFNELIGAQNGYRVLADSNLDWGQDLPALAHYLNGRPVHLSYFGQADPAYYGINADPLPAWPPPLNSHFVPADPAPGLYAISASNLVGVQLADPNTFAYFRNRLPDAVINYSIFVYDLPPHEPISVLAQCNPPLLNRAAVNQLFNGRAIRQLSFDCANSFLQPAAAGLSLYPENQTPLLDLGAPVFEWKRSDGTPYYRLYRTQAPASPQPLFPAKYLALLNYELTPQALTLHWLVTEPAPPPVSVFVHFNWPDGAMAEPYDALGVAAEYWQPGDVLTQRHLISPDLPPGDYGIVVGLYSLADDTRYSEINLPAVYKK